MIIRKTVSELLDSSVKARNIFEKFKSMFPDHPRPENTLIVVKKVEEPEWPLEILFICKHFEHNMYEDIVKLTQFMEYLIKELDAKEAYLTLLNSHTEKLVITIISYNEDKARELLGEKQS